MRIALWLSVVTLPVWAGCPLPPAHDLRRIEYSLEKIAASLTVALAFPKLSDLNCTEEKVAFGTVWRIPLDTAHPIQVQVTDRNHTLVQSFTLAGELELKITPTWGNLRFFGTAPSKAIFDHRIVSLDLFGSAAATPTITVDDQNQRRLLPAQIQVW